MKKLTCYLIDDEERAINSLEFLLDYYCNETAEVVGAANSYEDAVNYLTKNTPDLIFLDINLGEKTGFDVLEKLDDMPNTQIVMVTAYDEYALQAFKYNAINYLLKPVDPDELTKTLSRVSERSGKAAENSIADFLKTQQERMFFPNRNGYGSILFKEISFIKGDGSYVAIVNTQQEEITVSKNLSHFEKILEKHPQFIRVHKSYIINTNHITKIDKHGGLKVVLVNNQEIPVSPTMRDIVMSLIVV
ncbi:LytR/AlgR family response regulator transcription factor [Pedobacter sp. SL55]|uniref:LytR/AlgR family response regulator transcription factor n=1 Tax=Pedobacter sp. SL55 TaxID=2995161 RepID=UPI0022702A59|nr:LytTR family DNA-binding domain-containing protein [Pedobacter sp. SL55]WAC42522.1 LytTR family DNA-binding domain-containing protein [Pedobacter sp. SL55]